MIKKNYSKQKKNIFSTGKFQNYKKNKSWGNKFNKFHWRKKKNLSWKQLLLANLRRKRDQTKKYKNLYRKRRLYRWNKYFFLKKFYRLRSINNQILWRIFFRGAAPSIYKVRIENQGPYWLPVKEFKISALRNFLSISYFKSIFVIPKKIDRKTLFTKWRYIFKKKLLSLIKAHCGSKLGIFQKRKIQIFRIYTQSLIELRNVRGKIKKIRAHDNGVYGNMDIVPDGNVQWYWHRPIPIRKLKGKQKIAALKIVRSGKLRPGLWSLKPYWYIYKQLRNRLIGVKRLRNMKRPSRYLLYLFIKRATNNYFVTLTNGIGNVRIASSSGNAGIKGKKRKKAVETLRDIVLKVGRSMSNLGLRTIFILFVRNFRQKFMIRIVLKALTSAGVQVRQIKMIKSRAHGKKVRKKKPKRL